GGYRKREGVRVMSSRASARAARGETPAAFGRRCIPADCVAPPSHMDDMLGRRALSAGRLAGLGATLASHHGLLAAFAIVACAHVATAQNIGATLQGLIVDEQHAVLPGVSVTITNIETGIARIVTTDASGWYRAAALAPGNYEIRAELIGFVEFVRRGLTRTTGQEPRIDITLAVASVKETVTVTGETPLVDVTRNTIGTTITRRDLDSIPLVEVEVAACNRRP